MSELIIRPAGRDDLPVINRIIEKAMMTWTLPERVKRLALSSYQYDELDLAHLTLFVAVDKGTVVGAASLEPHAQPVEGAGSGLLLHGIYVDPGHHRAGIGTRLFNHAQALARNENADGLLVRAQKDAEAFFQAQGMHKLDIHDQQRDYENRYWKRIS